MSLLLTIRIQGEKIVMLQDQVKFLPGGKPRERSGAGTGAIPVATVQAG